MPPILLQKEKCSMAQMTARQLGEWWIEEICGQEVTRDKLEDTIRRLVRLRDKGYSSAQIEQKWVEYISGNELDSEKEYHIDSVFPQEKPIPGNLIDPNQTYLHPRLLRMPESIVSSMDKDGIVSHHNLGNWVIVPVQLFTLDDLVNYYYEKFPGVYQNRKRDTGALKFLLDRYGLDMLLFVIDAAMRFIEGEDKPLPKTPFEITNYDDEARRAYDEKMNFKL